ncbi:MAG UNVERIFIED_CONTAM: hypothetical protein LVR18_13635 [Planctomycetaceae bacterium]
MKAQKGTSDEPGIHESSAAAAVYCPVSRVHQNSGGRLWSYVFPLVMMISLGLAFRSDSVEPVSVCVEDGAAADQVRQVLQANPRFVVTGGTPEQCRQMLRSGKAELVLTIKGTDSARQYHFLLDQTRPGSVSAQDAVNDVLQRARPGGRIRWRTQQTAVTEAGSRYIDFLVPGLIGMGLMGGGVWGVGYAIVDMRIRQVLKRLLGTPMKKHHFVAAMMASRLVFMILRDHRDSDVVSADVWRCQSRWLFAHCPDCVAGSIPVCLDRPDHCQPCSNTGSSRLPDESDHGTDVDRFRHFLLGRSISGTGAAGDSAAAADPGNFVSASGDAGRCGAGNNPAGSGPDGWLAGDHIFGGTANFPLGLKRIGRRAFPSK